MCKLRVATTLKEEYLSKLLYFNFFSEAKTLEIMYCISSAKEKVVAMICHLRCDILRPLSGV